MSKRWCLWLGVGLPQTQRPLQLCDIDLEQCQITIAASTVWLCCYVWCDVVDDDRYYVSCQEYSLRTSFELSGVVDCVEPTVERREDADVEQLIGWVRRRVVEHRKELSRWSSIDLCRCHWCHLHYVANCCFYILLTNERDITRETEREEW